MRKLTTLLLLSIIFSASSQTTKISNLEFNFGWAKIGTGDINGFLYGAQYHQSFGKKIYWVVGFEGTFHDDPTGNQLFFELEGERFDSTIQLVTGIKYNFMENSTHTFGVYALPLLRYQATSINDLVDTLFPPITDLPFPVRVLINEEPSRTLSVGGTIRFNYNYTFNKDLYLGLLAGFQTDTNGDTMINAGVTFGKRFNF